MQAVVEFPGADQVLALEATWSHGVVPNVFTLTVAPQAPLAGGGTLRLRWGDIQIEFPDCRVDSSSFQLDGSGSVVQFQILDRRWKWQFPIISGHWNLRTDDGGIVARVPANRGIAIDNTEITPQDAARLLFAALGEANADVAALPNDARPTLEWEQQSAAQALADLCELFNCRVMLGLDNRAKIVALGEGAALPDGPLVDLQAAVDPPERPDALMMVTAPWRSQVDFILEPVVETADHRVLTLAAAEAAGLAPDGGWDEIDLWGGAALDGADNPAPPDRIKQTIFRWYRIQVPATVPWFPRIDTLDYVLPLEPTQVDTRNEGPRKYQRPAVVYGRYFMDDWRADLGHNVAAVSPLTDLDQRPVCRQAWSLDLERGIVQFSEPVIVLDANNKPAPADLRLRIGVSVRTAQTRQWNRYARIRELPGQQFGTAPQVILAEDLVPTVVPIYGAGFQIVGFRFNTPTLDAEMDKRLDAAAKAFEPHDPSGGRYVGFLRLDLDGAIQGMHWSMGPQGTFTVVSRNQDLGARNTVGYRIRRQFERARELARNPLLRGPEQERKRAIRRGGAG